jgi:glycosyltransferase involved in cell wall biosynthesis
MRFGQPRMKILCLTRYESLGASSRYRFYQYIPYLKGQGHQISIAPLLSNSYIRSIYGSQRLDALKIAVSYLRRFMLLIQVWKYDVIWMEKEAFPWLPSWFERLCFLTKAPVVIDFDDAIFHRYDQHRRGLIKWALGKKIDVVMRHADVVVAGNSYLANRALQSGSKKIFILPTVVDLNKYPRLVKKSQKRFRIGWIGSPSTTSYLSQLESVFQAICKDDDVEIVLIGAGKIEMRSVPLEIRPWREESESQELASFDVGIMPLPDNPWERGKCGLKLIQYMACSIPVVASPVGVNRDIVINGENGFLASNNEEWLQGLSTLKANGELRQTMGANGRRIVEERYSLSYGSRRLHELLISL